MPAMDICHYCDKRREIVGRTSRGEAICEECLTALAAIGGESGAEWMAHCRNRQEQEIKR